MPKPLLWITLIVSWLICIGSANSSNDISTTVTIVFVVMGIILGRVLGVERRSRQYTDERLASLGSYLDALQSIVKSVRDKAEHRPAESKPSPIASPAAAPPKSEPNDERLPASVIATQEKKPESAPQAPVVAAPPIQE